MKDLRELSDAALKVYREECKQKAAQYKLEQMIKKVCLNSAYGATGSKYFRYFDLRLAESITSAGQVSIRWVANRLNQYLNDLMKTDLDYVITIDTDSNYLNLEPIVEKKFKGKNPNVDQVVEWLDKFCKVRLQKVIDQAYKELAEYTNAYKQKMFMDREIIASKGVWVKKKRYAVLVHNSEGVQYDEPKLKVTGLDLVKSSTPEFCRDKMKEGVMIMMKQTEKDLIKFVSDTRKEFMASEPEQIAFPRGCQNLEKYSDSEKVFGFKCPIHVKGSLFFNYWIKKKNLTKKYELIKEGEKIKFLHLKEPNALGTPVISFVDVLPNEFNIDLDIDRVTQFHKSFLKPFGDICKVIGWEMKKKNKLTSLFK